MQVWQEYIDRKMNGVDGWLDAIDAKIIGNLADHQQVLGLKGGAVEIGVHHGKLFLLLATLLRPDENCLAIDLFEDQSKNIDRSGRGDRERFLGNFNQLVKSRSELKVLSKSSLEVSWNEISELVGGARLFSVDGGHTAECTLNDLLLASKTLVEGGILILDDYFNAHWPDVSVGTNQFLAHESCRVVPFAIARNKVFFTTANFVMHYRSMLRSRFDDLLIRSSEMAGSEVDIYGVSHTLPSLFESAKFELKRKKIGRWLSGVSRKYRRFGAR